MRSFQVLQSFTQRWRGGGRRMGGRRLIPPWSFQSGTRRRRASLALRLRRSTRLSGRGGAAGVPAPPSEGALGVPTAVGGGAAVAGPGLGEACTGDVGGVPGGAGGGGCAGGGAGGGAG